MIERWEKTTATIKDGGSEGAKCDLLKHTFVQSIENRILTPFARASSSQSMSLFAPFVGQRPRHKYQLTSTQCFGRIPGQRHTISRSVQSIDLQVILNIYLLIVHTLVSVRFREKRTLHLLFDQITTFLEYERAHKP